MNTSTRQPDIRAVQIQALERAVGAVVMIDAEGCIALFNQAAETLWGYSRTEVLGQSITLLLPSFSQLDDHTDRTMEMMIEHKNGQVLCGALSIVPLPVEDGTAFRAICIQDVTEEVQRREELRLLSLAVNETGNAVAITGPDGKILYVNEGFTRMLGYTLDEVCGQIPSEFLSGPHTDPKSIDYARSQVTLQKEFHLEVLVYGKHEKPLWISAVINPVFDESGQLKNMVAVYTDITHTKMHEVLQRKVLHAMVRDAPLGEVMDLICREVERIAPHVVATILRVDANDRLQPLAAPSMPEHITQAIAGVAIGPDVGSCGAAAYWGEQVVVTDIATDPRWTLYKGLFLPLGLVGCWSNPIKSKGGQVQGTLAFYSYDHREPDDFLMGLAMACEHLCAIALERDEAREHIRQLAFYDVLTGLPNRRRLYSKATLALAQAARENTTLAVLFVDLDRFKQVNDSLGHAAGDELLCEVAQRIEAEVGKNDIVGRLSGDEFVIVAPHYDRSQSTKMAERVLTALSRPVLIGGAKLRPSASIGISLFPCSGVTFEMLLQHADMAMYQAKLAGRNCYGFFSAEMNQQAQERQALELALRDALEQNQLRLHYQPQISLREGKLFGVEALARWQHPQMGNISPVRFVPLAEECGLILELSHWALQEACRQLAEWRQKDLDIPTVSVNLSPQNFHHLGLPKFVAETLQSHSLKPKDLTLEITESVLLDESPGTLSAISKLREQGIRLSIDDFGTGYSSLGYLYRLPVDEIKLDKRFVQDLENNEAAQALTKAIIHIGESMRLTVVAEGVEKEAQSAFLCEQGCQVAQGYLFARPLPAHELEQWMISALSGPEGHG